jgi:hypothetical protein
MSPNDTKTLSGDFQSLVQVLRTHELARIQLEDLCSAVIRVVSGEYPDAAKAYTVALERIKGMRGEYR